ncbi:isoprenylcysteine carboxylmethyltransferase family protein [bacterium]|nr:isoprenylcysteine carboxylmethyltransferase family protein [bacterium]
MKNNKTKRHEGRADLIGEHTFGDRGQLILLAIFLIIWITDSFIFNYSTSLQDKIPNSIRMLIGFPILIIAGIFAKYRLGIVFGEVRDKPEVIEKSVFKIVRHPIYLGSILLYLGLTILTCSIASTLIWVIIVIFYYYISKYEEKLLLKKFGKEYKNYMERVPMLIPLKYKKKKHEK